MVERLMDVQLLSAYISFKVKTLNDAIQEG